MSETGGKASPAEGRALRGQDRRRHRRVALALPGRFMLEDGSEHACECIDISAVGVRLRAAKAGAWGSRVVVYIEGVGRMEGHLVRRAPGWFAIETHPTLRKGERVEERIAGIAEAIGESDERRRLSRKYLEQQAVRLVSADGRLHPAEIADISKEGAALLTEARLEPGARVRLDGRRAKVVRAFPGGLALAFEAAPEPAARRPTSPLLARSA